MAGINLDLHPLVETCPIQDKAADSPRPHRFHIFEIRVPEVHVAELRGDLLQSSKKSRRDGSSTNVNIRPLAKPLQELAELTGVDTLGKMA